MSFAAGDAGRDVDVDPHLSRLQRQRHRLRSRPSGRRRVHEQRGDREDRRPRSRPRRATDRRSRRTSSSSVGRRRPSRRRRRRRRRASPCGVGVERRASRRDRPPARRRPPPTGTALHGTSSSSLGRTSLVVGRQVPEPAVHHLAAERGGHDQRREHDQLGDQERAVVGALAARRCCRPGATPGSRRRRRARRSRRARARSTGAAPRAARRRRLRGSTTARHSITSPPSQHAIARTCTRVGRDREPGLDRRCRRGPRARREREPDADQDRGDRATTRARVLGRRPAAQQEPQQRERDHEQREPHAARPSRSACRARRRTPSGRSTLSAAAPTRTRPRARCPARW